MMRALFSGVSGLKSHQTRMDVIGNNIANVNTTGFKAKRLNFADMLYQTTQAGSASNTESMRGGINPRQIGLGVKTGAINTSITTEGASQSTGNPFDLKLTGEAFFIVSDGTNTYYTRDGSFDVDDAGYLVMANTGYTVMGWTLPEAAANDETATIVQGATVSPINVKQFTSYNPGASTGAYITGIIDKNDKNLLVDGGRQVNLQFYDKMGYEFNLKFGIEPVKQTVGGSTRDVTTEEEYYDFAGESKKLYIVDNSKITYQKQTADGTTMEYKSSVIPKFDETVEELAKKAHTVGASESIIVTTTVSNSKMTIICLKPDGSVATDATNNPIKKEIDISTDATGKKYDFSEWTNNAAFAAGGASANLSQLTTRINVNFDGSPGFALDAAGNDIVDIPAETLLAIMHGKDSTLTALPGVTDPATSVDLPSLRITSKSYVDEMGVDQKIYTIEVDQGGGTYEDITGEINYSDLSQLLKAVIPTTMPAVTTTEQVDPTGFMPGEYTLTLLGMTDSTGVTVDTSDLGEVVYNLRYNPDNGLFSYVGSEGNDSFTLNLSTLGDGNFSDLTIDMSDTKNVDNEGKCTLEGLRSDGRKDGKWTGVSISTDGTVTVNYSNGMTRDVAQIAVATFGNAMGLENAGDNLYKESQSSGEASIVDIAASGTGYMTSGVLEMSNVDLSQEFTEMITTQRGFQANSRIITTSDSLLEELVNLKR